MTMTCARFSSSCVLQPLPYWNEAPNIEKKSAVTEAIERYKQYQIWKTTPLVTAEAMNQLQDMLIASAVMKDSARVKYEDVVVADFAKKAQ